jgi:hypothetical protein
MGILMRNMKISVSGSVLALLLLGAFINSAQAQQCTGCRCNSTPDIHPVHSLPECVAGCTIWEIICSGDTVVKQGLTFTSKPAPVPKDCTLRPVLDGGTLTGNMACPASGPVNGTPFNCHHGATANAC